MSCVSNPKPWPYIREYSFVYKVRMKNYFPKEGCGWRTLQSQEGALKPVLHILSSRLMKSCRCSWSPVCAFLERSSTWARSPIWWPMDIRSTPLSLSRNDWRVSLIYTHSKNKTQQLIFYTNKRMVWQVGCGAGCVHTRTHTLKWENPPGDVLISQSCCCSICVYISYHENNGVNIKQVWVFIMSWLQVCVCARAFV